MYRDNGQVVRDFVKTFALRDASMLSPYLHADIQFEAYGDAPIVGREALLAMWQTVFDSMARVEFSTLFQAVNGEIVIEEQIHGLALPGRPMGDIKNMAIYRINDGLVMEWRDYTNPEFARTKL